MTAKKKPKAKNEAPPESATVFHGYNGYKNFSTWAVAAFLDGDELQLEKWRDRADRLLATHQGDRMTAFMELSDEIREDITKDVPLLAVSLYNDLLNGALSDVEWMEVATSRVKPK